MPSVGLATCARSRPGSASSRPWSGSAIRPGEATQRLAQELSLTHMGLLAQATEIPAAHIRFLKRVHAAYPVALVSNFDHGPTARLIVDRDGAAPYFHQIVISDDHGWRKPHPKIFTDTLELLQVAARDALFVGDSPHDDVLGAKRAGLDTAWVNATGADLPEGIPNAGLHGPGHP